MILKLTTNTQRTTETISLGVWVLEQLTKISDLMNRMLNLVQNTKRYRALQYYLEKKILSPWSFQIQTAVSKLCR